MKEKLFTTLLFKKIVETVNMLKVQSKAFKYEMQKLLKHNKMFAKG